MSSPMFWNHNAVLQQCSVALAYPKRGRILLVHRSIGENRPKSSKSIETDSGSVNWRNKRTTSMISEVHAYVNLKIDYFHSRCISPRIWSFESEKQEPALKRARRAAPFPFLEKEPRAGAGPDSWLPTSNFGSFWNFLAPSRKLALLRAKY